MIDVHTHIIPSVDDGAGKVEETFNLIKEAKEARVYRYYFDASLYNWIL